MHNIDKDLKSQLQRKKSQLHSDLLLEKSSAATRFTTEFFFCSYNPICNKKNLSCSGARLATEKKSVATRLATEKIPSYNPTCKWKEN